MDRIDISANSITGELIACEKYQFVDGRLIAAIVNDVIDIIKAKQRTGLIEK